MHVPDGLLPGSICVGGYVTAGVLTWASLRRIHRRADPASGVPIASVMTAAFFVASWIHVPIPPASAHLVLNGLIGVVLGAYAVPAILVGLFLQAVMFQHGGLSTLGVNATILGLPAVGAALLYRWPRPPRRRGAAAAVKAFAAGALGLLVSAALGLALIAWTVPGQAAASGRTVLVTTLATAHLPLAAIEGALTAGVVLFLLRVRPWLLTEPGGEGSR
jgi:cobalt/nickel transport system permease protein